MGPNPADGELRRKIEEYRAREDVYVAGLIGQEAETNHLRQMASNVLGAYGDLSRAAVRGALIEPAQNMEVLLLRQKAREKDQQINQLKEELEANRFDQKLPSGQALMKKCKALLTENRELGEEIREERLAELSAAVQAEQRQNAELQQKCQEAMDFCKELSQENEKLQGTIAKVAGRLREASTELTKLQADRAEAKAQRKKEKEEQKKAMDAAALTAETPLQQGMPAPAAEGVFVLAPPLQAAPLASPASAVEPEVLPVPAEPPAQPAVPLDEVTVIADSAEAAAAAGMPDGGEPVEKEKREKKKKRKSDGADEAPQKDKKEKKRHKAEKAAAAAASA